MSEDFIVPGITENLSLIRRKLNEEFDRLHGIIDKLEEDNDKLRKKNDKLRKKNDELEGIIYMLEETLQELNRVKK